MLQSLHQIQGSFMSYAIITLLGKIPPPQKGQKAATYTLSKELQKNFTLKKENYTNMLPLLVDNFANEYSIVSIYTQEAKEVQKRVLAFENLEFNIEKDGIFIADTKQNTLEASYPYFLEKYNEAIERYDEVIIDLSHGFRHLPILAIVSIFIQSIKDTSKIKHIFYAKELQSFTSYEVIDLIEYVDLAKLSFVLSAFEANYTIGNNISFHNEHYEELVDNLSIISRHLLSNSLQQLIGKNTLLATTRKQIEQLLEHEKNFHSFEKSLKQITNHLLFIETLEQKPYYQQLLALAKLMKERDYLLNSITLLNEAVGLFCAEFLKSLDKSVKKHIESFEQRFDDKYKLASQSKHIIRLQKNFLQPYLFKDITLKALLLEKLRKQDTTQLVKLIEDVGALRNNLAHGNSADAVANVKLTLHKHITEFEKIINANEK